MELIEEIKTALFSANPDVKSNIKKCNRALRVLLRILKDPTTVNLQKPKITNGIALVKSYKAQFNALKIVGEGYQPRKQTARDFVKWVDGESAFKTRVRSGVIVNLKHSDPKKFMDDANTIFNRRILSQLKKDFALKVNAVFCGEFVVRKADVELRELKYMNTKNAQIYKDTDLRQWFVDNIQEPILKDLEEFQEKDSGWALSSIINLQVNINKFTPQLGSSYIELPYQIQRKQACINVKNDDNMCFAWAVVSALYPVDKNTQRVNKYPNPSEKLNLIGIRFPMTLKQIPRFEKQNKLSINVYVLKKSKKTFSVHPTYLTKEKMEKHVNLLLIQEDYDDDDDMAPQPKFHYVWIKNLSRLLNSQLTKHNNAKKYFCDRCLHYFYTEAKRDKHYEDCVKMNDCKIRLPTESEKYLHFKNYKNKVKAPFVIYADLECILKPVANSGNAYQQHIPCSVGYYIKCSYDDTLSFYRAYRGDDCIQWFTKELENFAEDVETVFLCPLPMDALTPEEFTNFNKAETCHICEKPFTTDDYKVQDHCHLTGKYRGPAHNGCNINFKDTHTIPIIFHNLSGYDSHFIINSIATDMPGRVDVLPITKEKYISFTKNTEEYLIRYRFIDSFRFMASSLDTLSGFLTTYPELVLQYNGMDDDKLKLLTRKGVYPYDYMTDFNKFNDTQLPKRSQFYNTLNDCNITEEDCQHAQRVWSEFQITDLGQYSDLYLKTDVLLLACVFEQFRQSSLNTYGLDPAHYYTLPGYTWDCMLKHTNITLELLTDIDMLMFVERGIRGGLSQCSLRYAKANNKYMSDYDSSKEEEYLLYTDINNQYGWAMSQYLPYGGFAWLKDDEMHSFRLDRISDTSDVGYILEVDLEYPSHLHDKHSDLPFCPEHRSGPNSKEQKLMATLYDKKRYVLHYKNLQQCLDNGLLLTKIHRILKFNQSPWLRTYIDLNTQLRTAAVNEFEKNLFKLMNNAVFGKTMENIRKHSIVKLISKWNGRYGAEALISKPEFKSCTIFNENLVAVELNKTEIFFNKPIYIGMAILDISKTKIYEFHYDYMKPMLGDKCKVAYTDTDSIIYSIKHQDIYNIIRRDCGEKFDTSDYPKDNVYGIPQVNKKVLGMMKDEMNGRIMTEFIGLRSKMYAIRVKDKDSTKKIKGVKKHIVKTYITFDDYVDCLNSLMDKCVEQRLIKSEKHQVASITTKKIALSPHDDKRYIINGSHNTLPWGHYSIMDCN